MNLVYFSIKTKGTRNFIRRLWTVFTRFGFSEEPTRRALHSVIDLMRDFNGSPTFFIPAVVLERHTNLIREIVESGAEVGIHGYVHNDYRSLAMDEQYKQTEMAIKIFEKTRIPYKGFRNPYLGWTEESVKVFTSLGFVYESNEATIHDVVDLKDFPPPLKESYEKSLILFQALPCNLYTLRPHFEGTLLRIPTSIPDDEMLVDRLRVSVEEVGHIWSRVMQRVYDLGGIYTLNLHPERALSCKPSLSILLAYARSQALPVWRASLVDVAMWWKERSQFRLQVSAEGVNRWRVKAICTPRATLLARNLTIEEQMTTSWFGNDVWINSHDFLVNSEQRPCIGVSMNTPQQVIDFLLEQGYPAVYCTEEDAPSYAYYLDLPVGLTGSREDQIQKRTELVQSIEYADTPLLHFGNWPNGSRAALTVSGDIDSVTVQDFFLRILEVTKHV